MEVKKYTLKPSPREIDGLTNQDKLFLTVQIGNGQIGISKVSINDEQIAKGNFNSPRFIGEVKNLKDKEIIIETNILDENEFTNMCVFTTNFINQDNKIVYTKIDNGEAPENGVASFKGKYNIILSILLIFNILFFHNLKAQKSDNKITFKDLETPSSPGFILLDKTPSSIERPTNPQGFGFNVLSLLQGGGGAMEFAPFWLVNHPNLTAEKMYKNKFPILYNFSISAATIKNDTLNYLASGFRTRITQLYNKSNHCCPIKK